MKLYNSLTRKKEEFVPQAPAFQKPPAPIQSISCFLQKCLLAKYIPAQMAMASTR